MNTWIILPYDGSPVARAALRRAARLVESGDGRYAGVMLATTGVDLLALDTLMAEAQEITGSAVPLELRLLAAGDPISDLQRLTAATPEAMLAAPLRPTGCAPWYAEACRHGGPSNTLVLFFLTPKEIAKFTEVEDGRHRMGGPLGALLRAGARLRLGERAPVGGGVR
jgi:hypothetical protein